MHNREAGVSDFSVDAVREQLLAVLQEAFEGPKRWSYFTDHGADAGLVGTVTMLNAAEASRPVGGTSIAAHVQHVLFGLAASSAWIRGDKTPRNWKDSWRTGAADQAAWSLMPERIRSGHEELRDAIASHALSSAEAMGGAVGAIAHVAYHLGAIRQKVLYQHKT
jgi:hypothetical protein